VLQWPKVLEEKEKVTRLTIFGSGKYLPSQKYVMMIKNIFFIYIFVLHIYGLQPDKRFLQKITNFFQMFLWKRIATKAA
jgi:hypothetical protein